MDTKAHELVFPEESYQIMGACFAVYREMGSGFLEAVIQECLEREMASRGIPFLRQHPIPIRYRGQFLRQVYLADFVCFGKIIVEIKTMEEIVDGHRAQVLNYLAATGLRLGLLVNFGHKDRLQWQRLVR
ncbi:MAG TPA: GxxExxY protein [Candidatus Didemnitutus sp.]